MCGVIGYFAEEPRQEHLITLGKVFRESRIRGKHAYGFSYFGYYPDRLGVYPMTLKSHSLDYVIKSIGEVPLRSKMGIIGHTRYSTSGDYTRHTNNQPIDRYSEQGISLAFNGVISQKTKEEYEKEYGVSCLTENDGEILVIKAIKGEDIAAWVKNATFSFAGLLIWKNGIYALRNERRPLWIRRERGATYAASTKDIFRRAGIDGAEELPPGELICLGTRDE